MMMAKSRLSLVAGLTLSMVLSVLLAVPAKAQVAKQGNDVLSSLAFSHEKLDAAEESELLDNVRAVTAKSLQNGWEAFRIGVGPAAEWQASIDKRSGLVSFAEGGNVAWIPGHGNGMLLQGPRRLPEGEAGGRPRRHGRHRARLPAARPEPAGGRRLAAGAQPGAQRPARRLPLVRRLRRGPRGAAGRRGARRLPRQQRQPDPVRLREPPRPRRQGAADPADRQTGASPPSRSTSAASRRATPSATAAASTCCRPPSPTPSSPRGTRSAAAAPWSRSGRSSSIAKG